jgi:hypothetical protein
MATKFKPFWEFREEQAYKRVYEIGLAMGEALIQGHGYKGQMIVRFIKLTQWEDAQIAYILDAPIDLVKSIRLELKN